MSDDSEAVEAARKEAEAVEKQSKLFVGLKFFLGREVNNHFHNYLEFCICIKNGVC